MIRSRPSRVGSLPVAAVSLTAAMALFHALSFGGGLTPADVVEGAAWRLLTGHLVHFGRAHFVGDVIAFAVWAALVEYHGRALLLLTVTATMLVVSFWVVLCCPEVREYRGISAVDCALAVQLLLIGLERRLRSGAWLGAALLSSCLVAFVAKTAFELTAGHAVLASDLGRGVRLLPSAHVIGAAIGTLGWAVFTWRPCRRAR